MSLTLPARAAGIKSGRSLRLTIDHTNSARDRILVSDLISTANSPTRSTGSFSRD